MDENLRKLQEEVLIKKFREDKDAFEPSFQPMINNESLSIVERKRGATGGFDEFLNKAKQIEREKQEKIEVEQLKSYHQEMEQCRFKP